jgi:DNA-directed RNA polymerase subunit alpha
METLGLAELVASEEPSTSKLFDAKRQVFTTAEARRELEAVAKNVKNLVKDLSSENRATVRQGVVHWLNGELEKAVELMKDARPSKERDLILGVCHMEAGRFRTALELLKAAFEADRDDAPILLHYGECLIRTGEIDEAEKIIERLEKKHEAHPDLPFLKGLLQDVQGNHAAAVACYEKALDADAHHQKAMFQLAYKYDLLGLEEQASELYDQLRVLRPVHVNSMINLGVLYEDEGEYDKAIECYQAVVEAYPTHWRAAMYLKDAQASLKMFYDEEAMKKEERRRQLSMQHVADMTLTTRAKNALLKARVFTLADLIGKSEDELLDLPGLGATAIKEIKELLHSKGLSLQSHKEITVDEYLKTVKPEVLSKPLSDFEWSGRVKKLFERLGFITTGDLLRQTEKDLLKNRNFGQTSLKEIRLRLNQLGVELRTG